MKFLIFILLMGIFPVLGQKEKNTLSVEDSIRLNRLRVKSDMSLSQLGKMFLGVPYVSGVLERGNDFSVEANLHELDCTTFVEVLLSLSKTDTLKQKYFLDKLENIRYREGAARGYTSRLHYFTDWIKTNESKGLIVDVTKSIGGEIVRKPIDFMSKHREKYLELKSDENLKEIQRIEKSLSNKYFYEIPKEQICLIASKIKDGDIIAITTKIKGLDITHVGIATWQKASNTLHLLHASSAKGAVVVSEKTLSEYLKGNSLQKGIIVLRVK